MKTFFNIFSSILFIVLVTSCSTEMEGPERNLNSEIIEIIPVCDGIDICCFDLSDQSGEYELLSKWEFVGYQEKKGESLDNLTCLARIAEFSLGGDDYDKITRVTLILSGKISPLANCENSPIFLFKSFNKEINGCFDSNHLGDIQFNFGPENVILTPSNNYTTMPMVNFEYNIENDLSNVEKYEIDHNKLYLHIRGKSEKMLFIDFIE